MSENMKLKQEEFENQAIDQIFEAKERAESMKKLANGENVEIGKS